MRSLGVWPLQKSWFVTGVFTSMTVYVPVAWFVGPFECGASVVGVDNAVSAPVCVVVGAVFPSARENHVALHVVTLAVDVATVRIVPPVVAIEMVTLPRRTCASVVFVTFHWYTA